VMEECREQKSGQRGCVTRCLMWIM
jgi:hypothetical protein